MTQTRCRQCGKPYSARACGPSHALVHAERKAVAPSIKRLKQRIARISWRFPDDARRYITHDVNLAIDEWAEAERKRAKP